MISINKIFQFKFYHLKIKNTYIKGRGISLDRLIIVGNHRDAWTYGAADPSSGTAVMMEVSRALGWLKKKHGIINYY